MDRNAINRIAQRINMEDAAKAQGNAFKAAMAQEAKTAQAVQDRFSLEAAQLEAAKLAAAQVDPNDSTEAYAAHVVAAVDRATNAFKERIAMDTAKVQDWEKARAMVAEVDRRTAIREAGERHKASGWSKQPANIWSKNPHKAKVDVDMTGVRTPADLIGRKATVTVTTEKEESTMSHERTVRMNAMLSGFDRVAVCFPSSPKQYHYRAPRSMKVKAGDKVVIDSPYTGMTIAHVDFVDGTLNPDRPYRYKQIVGKVDVDAYYDRCEAEVKLEEQLEALEARKAIEDEIRVLQDSMTSNEMDAFTRLVEQAKGRA